MDRPQVIIRDATETDIPAILKMHAKSWLDTYPNKAAGISREWVQGKVEPWLTNEKIEKRRKIIRESASNPNYMYRIAENEEKEVIALIAPFRDDKTQRVGAIYVDRAYHGTGLAQQLMDQIIEWADQTRPLELEVATYNERAKNFYRQYNFQEVEGSEHLVHEKIPVVTMIRNGDEE